MQDASSANLQRHQFGLGLGSGCRPKQARVGAGFVGAGCIIVANLIATRGMRTCCGACRYPPAVAGALALLCVGRDDGILRSLRHRAQTLGV